MYFKNLKCQKLAVVCSKYKMYNDLLTLAQLTLKRLYADYKISIKKKLMLNCYLIRIKLYVYIYTSHIYEFFLPFAIK